MHKGVVHCIRYLIDTTDDTRVLLSGGADLKVNVINPETMNVITSVDVEAVPRSVDYSKYLLVGLRNGTIYEYDMQSNTKEAIMHSHHDGEVWGLCTVEN